MEASVSSWRPLRRQGPDSRLVRSGQAPGTRTQAPRHSSSSSHLFHPHHHHHHLHLHHCHHYQHTHARGCTRLLAPLPPLAAACRPDSPNTSARLPSPCCHRLCRPYRHIPIAPRHLPTCRQAGCSRASGPEAPGSRSSSSCCWVRRAVFLYVSLGLTALQVNPPWERCASPPCPP